MLVGWPRDRRRAGSRRCAMETRANFGVRYPESRAQPHRCHRTRVAGYGRLGRGRKSTGRWSRHLMENDRCWSQSEFQRQRSSRHCCRAGAAENEVFPYAYISTPTGKPTDKFMMPVSSFNVISGGSHTGNCLACPEFSIVPTEAGSVAEDMITVT